MSHMIKVKASFKNLDILERACKNLGWTLNKNSKTFKWYGTWVADYHEEDAAYKMGVDPETFGQCEHSISIPGCEYEAGLIKGEKEGELDLVFDNFDHNLAKVLGGKFHPEVTNPLPQQYAKEAFLEKLGNSEIDVWSIDHSVDEEGNMRLKIEVNE